MKEFDRRNTQILGCSFDSAEENEAFAKKYGYGFPLLCDTERKVGMAYGACSLPEAAFPDRISFVIDETGIIKGRLPKVNPTTHTDDILALLD